MVLLLPQLLMVLLFLPLASPDSCAPILQVDPSPSDGSRTASLSAPPGCHCDNLWLSVNARKRNNWQHCDETQKEDCKWQYLKRPSANYSLVVAGRYRPNGRCCRRRVGAGCSAVPANGESLWVPGLRLLAWNVTVSLVPLAADRLSVNVVRQFGADADAGRVFFRRLRVGLYRLDDRWRLIERRRVECSDSSDDPWAAADVGRCSAVEFAGLQPDDYAVDVSPLDEFGGVVDSGRHRQLVKVAAPREPVPATLDGRPHRAPLRPWLLPLLSVSILLVLLLLVLTTVTCWMRCRRAHRDRPAADAGTVLLLPAHSQAPELDTIKAHLWKLGVRVRDFRERDVLNAFHSQACVSEALKLPALREARLVFVCAGPDSPPLRPAAAHLWDSVRCYVRNWRPTELLVLTTADGLGHEAAGLAAARAFDVPGDLDTLVRHLRKTAVRDRPPSVP